MRSFGFHKNALSDRFRKEKRLRGKRTKCEPQTRKMNMLLNSLKIQKSSRKVTVTYETLRCDGDDINAVK
jgi:hypothetical protein